MRLNKSRSPSFIVQYKKKCSAKEKNLETNKNGLLCFKLIGVSAYKEKIKLNERKYPREVFKRSWFK